MFYILLAYCVHAPTVNMITPDHVSIWFYEENNCLQKLQIYMHTESPFWLEGHT